MADIFSKEKRSEIMSRIGGRNTKPEVVVRKFLHAQGFRYRLHVKGLPGNPDIVLPKYKTVIFVHGCFWHQHEHCSKSSLPKTNTPWWKEKLQKNVLRDQAKQRELIAQGWRVLLVWQCDISGKSCNKTLQKLVKNIGRM